MNVKTVRIEQTVQVALADRLRKFVESHQLSSVVYGAELMAILMYCDAIEHAERKERDRLREHGKTNLVNWLKRKSNWEAGER